MKEIEIVAKTKGQPDAHGKCVQFESIAEAEKALGSDVVLSFINAKVKDRALNKLRRPAAGTGGLAKMIIAAKKTGKLSKEAQEKLADLLRKAGVDVSSL